MANRKSGSLALQGSESSLPERGTRLLYHESKAMRIKMRIVKQKFDWKALVAWIVVIGTIVYFVTK